MFTPRIVDRRTEVSWGLLSIFGAILSIIGWIRWLR
jgi:hypothetical protein